MHSDDEPALKSAFAELHRRQRDQAPPFAAMRERAVRALDFRARERWSVSALLRIPLAAAFSVVAVALCLWTLRTPVPREVASVAPTPPVEELLAAIEHELEVSAAISSPIYATDILLTQNQTSQLP